MMHVGQFSFVPLVDIGRTLLDHLIGGYLEVSYVVSRPEDIDLK
jgi:hypothetical protein